MYFWSSPNLGGFVGQSKSWDDQIISVNHAAPHLQIHKFTNSQIHRICESKSVLSPYYTNSQIHKFANSQIHKFTNSQIHKIHKFTNSQIHKTAIDELLTSSIAFLLCTFKLNQSAQKFMTLVEIVTRYHILKTISRRA